MYVTFVYREKFENEKEEEKKKDKKRKYKYMCGIY